MIQFWLLLPGFASSSRSYKAAFFRQKCTGRSDIQFDAFDFNPMPVDFEFMTITGMINRLRQFLLERELAPLTLIGSSMGGLVAVNYAHRFGGVDRLLLLAPALAYHPRPTPAWQADGFVKVPHYAFGRDLPLRYDLEIDGQQYLTPPPPAAPTTIIHGTKDEVVPFSGSTAYAAAYPDQVRLAPIDAGHDINDHLPLIWRTAIASTPAD